MKKHYFNVSYTKGLQSKDECILFINEFQFPAIILPVDSTGGIGVTRVNEKENLGIVIDI